jgi:hypothetical protein
LVSITSVNYTVSQAKKQPVKKEDFPFSFPFSDVKPADSFQKTGSASPCVFSSFCPTGGIDYPQRKEEPAVPRIILLRRKPLVVLACLLIAAAIFLVVNAPSVAAVFSSRG